MIITIARQSGSGGYTVGSLLSKRYGLPIHDQDSLSRLAKEKGIYDKMPGFFDESPVNSIVYALSLDFKNKKFSEKERAMLEHLLPEENFILVGRCGNYIFRNRNDAVTLFVHGDLDIRVRYKAGMLGISEKKAKDIITATDESRLAYHRFYTGETWGEAANYDLSIDTGRIGHQGAAEIVEEYIKKLGI